MTFEDFTEVVKAAFASELPGAVVRTEDSGELWHVLVDGELLYGQAWGMAVESSGIVEYTREMVDDQIRATLRRKRDKLGRAKVAS